MENDRKVFVRNLPFAVTSFELRHIFSKYGKVEYASIACEFKGRKKVSKGYGFVLFKSYEDAQNAVKSEYKTIYGRKTQSVLASERDREKRAMSAVEEVLSYLNL